MIVLLLLNHVFNFSPMMTGMVRLRLLRINPDFFHPSIPPSLHQLPNWSFTEKSVAHWSFSDRYLLESLLSHGTVTLPEVSDLVKSIHEYYTTNSTLVLEGLSKRKRRSSIEHDLKSTCPRYKIPTLHRRLTYLMVPLQPSLVSRSTRVLRPIA